MAGSWSMRKSPRYLCGQGQPPKTTTLRWSDWKGPFPTCRRPPCTTCCKTKPTKRRGKNTPLKSGKLDTSIQTIPSDITQYLALRPWRIETLWYKALGWKRLRNTWSLTIQFTTGTILLARDTSEELLTSQVFISRRWKVQWAHQQVVNSVTWLTAILAAKFPLGSLISCRLR